MRISGRWFVLASLLSSMSLAIAAAPRAELRVFITNGGVPVPNNANFVVFPAGQRRGEITHGRGGMLRAVPPEPASKPARQACPREGRSPVTGVNRLSGVHVEGSGRARRQADCQIDPRDPSLFSHPARPSTVLEKQNGRP